MTVLGGGEKNVRNAKGGGNLNEGPCRSEWVLRRRGRCAGVEEGARRVWEERDCGGLTGCGCAGSGTERGGVERMQRWSAWRLAGEWCAAGFGRR